MTDKSQRNENLRREQHLQQIRERAEARDLDFLALHQTLSQQAEEEIHKTRGLAAGQASVAFVHGAGDVGLGQEGSRSKLGVCEEGASIRRR